MELKVTVHFRNTYVKIGELTLDGFYNEVFMDVLDKSNSSELLSLGLLDDKADLPKFIPEENHQNLMERGYNRDENPDFFNDYKEVYLPEIIEFYKKFVAIIQTQPNKLQQLGDNSLRDYYMEQIGKLINVFALCVKNEYKCNFTAYAS